jgi:hypothetical protein
MATAILGLALAANADPVQGTAGKLMGQLVIPKRQDVIPIILPWDGASPISNDRTVLFYLPADRQKDFESHRLGDHCLYRQVIELPDDLTDGQKSGLNAGWNSNFELTVFQGNNPVVPGKSLGRYEMTWAVERELDVTFRADDFVPFLTDGDRVKMDHLLSFIGTFHPASASNPRAGALKKSKEVSSDAAYDLEKWAEQIRVFSAQISQIPEDVNHPEAAEAQVKVLQKRQFAILAKVFNKVLRECTGNLETDYLAFNTIGLSGNEIRPFGQFKLDSYRLWVSGEVSQLFKGDPGATREATKKKILFCNRLMLEKLFQCFLFDRRTGAGYGRQVNYVGLERYLFIP